MLILINYGSINRYLDFINLMSYDLNGGWNNHTGFNSPLYARSSETDTQKKLNVVRLLFVFKLNKWIHELILKKMVQRKSMNLQHTLPVNITVKSRFPVWWRNSEVCTRLWFIHIKCSFNYIKFLFLLIQRKFTDHFFFSYLVFNQIINIIHFSCLHLVLPLPVLLV